jgi:hypothetical protein
METNKKYIVILIFISMLASLVAGYYAVNRYRSANNPSRFDIIRKEIGLRETRGLELCESQDLGDLSGKYFLTLSTEDCPFFEKVILKKPNFIGYDKLIWERDYYFHTFFDSNVQRDFFVNYCADYSWDPENRSYHSGVLFTEEISLAAIEPLTGIITGRVLLLRRTLSREEFDQRKTGRINYMEDIDSTRLSYSLRSYIPPPIGADSVPVLTSEQVKRLMHGSYEIGEELHPRSAAIPSPPKN